MKYFWILILIFAACATVRPPSTQPDMHYDSIDAVLLSETSDSLVWDDHTLNQVLAKIDSLSRDSIYIAPDKNIERLQEKIAKLVRLDTLLQHYADEQQNPAIATAANEFVFRALAGSQARLDQAFQNKDRENYGETYHSSRMNLTFHFQQKVSHMLPVIQSNSSYSELKTNILKRTVNMLPELQSGQRREAWAAIEDMLAVVNISKSEYDYEPFNRSARGLFLKPDELSVMLRRAYEAETDQNIKTIALGIIKDVEERSHHKPDSTFLHKVRESRAHQKAFRSFLQEKKQQETEKDAAYWFERGRSTEEPEDQIEYYSQAIRIDPRAAKAYNNRGLAFMAVDSLKQAAADFQKAVGLDPLMGPTFYHLGIVYQDQGDDKRALEYFDRAGELMPGFVELLKSRAKTHRKMGHVDAAINDYTMIVQQGKASAVIYNNRGNLYRQQDELERAIADYTRALEIDSVFVSAYLNRGGVYRQTGYYKDAVLDFTRALQIDSNLVSAFNDRGVAYRKLKEYQLALQDHLKAIELNPESATAFYNIGCVYWERRDWAETVRAWQACLRVDPEHQTAATWLPKARQRLLRQTP